MSQTYGVEKVADKRLVEVLDDYSDSNLNLSINEALPRQKGMSDLMYLNMKLDLTQNNAVRIQHLRNKAKAVSDEIIKRCEWVGETFVPDKVNLEVNLVCNICGQLINIVKVATYKDKLRLACETCEKAEIEP